MRHYETVFIMVPDLPDEEREGIVDRYRSVITDAGGDLLVTDDWGRRRLAYEIKNFTKGHYVLFEHASQPTIIAEMERQMRLDDQILRYLTIKLEETFDKDAYEAKKASEGESGKRHPDDDGEDQDEAKAADEPDEDDEDQDEEESDSEDDSEEDGAEDEESKKEEAE